MTYAPAHITRGGQACRLAAAQEPQQGGARDDDQELTELHPDVEREEGRGQAVARGARLRER